MKTFAILTFECLLWLAFGATVVAVLVGVAAI